MLAIGPKHGVWSCKNIRRTHRHDRHANSSQNVDGRTASTRSNEIANRAKYEASETRRRKMSKVGSIQENKRSDLPDDAVFLRSVAGTHEAMTCTPSPRTTNRCERRFTVRGKLRRSTQCSRIGSSTGRPTISGCRDWKESARRPAKIACRDIRNEVDSRSGGFDSVAFVQQIGKHSKRAWQNAPRMPGKPCRKPNQAQLGRSARENTSRCNRKKRSRTLKENVGEDVQRVFGCQIHDAKRRGNRGRSNGSKRFGQRSIWRQPRANPIGGQKIEEARQTLDTPRMPIDANGSRRCSGFARHAICCPQTRNRNRVPADTRGPPTRALGVPSENCVIRSNKVRDTRTKRRENVQKELNLQFKTLETRPCWPTGMTPYMQSQGDVLVFSRSLSRRRAIAARTSPQWMARRSSVSPRRR